ncbi:hypothetical protein GGH16_002303, partial [Coemansia sp. RSA 560]
MPLKTVILLKFNQGVMEREKRLDAGKAHELIDHLPRQTWHERSFAYWAEKQLVANDSWWKPLSTVVVGTATTTMSMFLRLGFRKVVVDDLHKLTDVLERERNRPI